MFFLIIILALVAAGIFTHAIIWYVFAGILAGFWLLISLVALIGAGVAIKNVNKEFNNLDKGFDSDFFKKNRPTRYRR